MNKNSRIITAWALATGLVVAGTVLAQTARPKVAPVKPVGAGQASATAGIMAPKIPVKVECPVQQVTVGVETPAQFPSPWWDTPFLMSLTGTQLTTINPGAKPGIACLYSGSGRSWDIARPIEPDYASCTPQGKSFSCIPK